MELLELLKTELKPDTSIIKEVSLFVEKINKRIQTQGIKAKCMTGGSIAKGTYLKDDYDIDLFVKFDPKYQNISDILEQILQPFKPTRVHGSRDYFQISNYEIVPVLDIKNPDEAQNVTDMSVLHVKWVKSHLKKTTLDDIRLAKKFCKAQGVYGAESYIRGFSGHVIDILVIHYGSFLNLLQNAQKWKPKVVIDPEKHYNNNRDLMFSMNLSKIEGPMILIDPILRTRNAASALSYEKFSFFKKRAKAFLKNPSKDFFREIIVTEAYLKKKYGNPVVITFKPKKGKKDVVGSKVIKAFKLIKSELIKRGFELRHSGWQYSTKVIFWFVPISWELPETRIITGPPIDKTQHLEPFKKKYSDVFEKSGKLYAFVKVSKRSFRDNLNDILANPYFAEVFR